ncbi:unnamed protein product, partial [Medioppia subpectinata]
MSVRIFEGTNHANLYSRFRPTVPDEVIAEVLRFLEGRIPSDKWDIAVDVGCGSGQGTNKLSKFFDSCYGYDVSRAQINEAQVVNHSHNVYYDVSPAESLPNIGTDSVQLVTAFTAAHWFDLQAFFSETDRILVNNGVVALICYLLPGPDPIDPLNPTDKRLIKLMSESYYDPRLAPYKNPKIVSTEIHYNDFRFPNHYDFVHKDNIVVSKTTFAHELVGYYQSWSLYQGLVLKDKPLADQCLQEFIAKLKDILKTDDLYTKEITYCMPITAIEAKTGPTPAIAANPTTTPCPLCGRNFLPERL